MWCGPRTRSTAGVSANQVMARGDRTNGIWCKGLTKNKLGTSQCCHTGAGDARIADSARPPKQRTTRTTRRTARTRTTVEGHCRIRSGRRGPAQWLRCAKRTAWKPICSSATSTRSSTAEVGTRRKAIHIDTRSRSSGATAPVSMLARLSADTMLQPDPPPPMA